MDSNIVAALITGVSTVAAAVVTVVYTRQRCESTPSNRRTSVVASAGGSLDFDAILARLENHHQRATFGAIAGYLGREPLTLFDGYPQRTPRTSWVVSKSTGKPTGQEGSALHPALFENPHVIRDTGNLRSCLASHV
jgi:hypothetical protein